MTTKKNNSNTDIVHIILSDMHTGSNHALFPNRVWHGLNKNNHTPESGQLKIWKHFEKYSAEVSQFRKGKKVILVVNGDAIDGDHHRSGDVCTTNPKEQADIHIEIMAEFQKRINWQRGDELYYTKGTEIHTGDWEDYIGQELNAQMDGSYYAFDFLELITNGVRSWFVHHGPAAGVGPNEGNTVRNWLKGICYDAMKDDSKTPDIVYTGHVHQPTYGSYIYREKMNFKTIHGIILPSWQEKTRYAWMRAPMAKNKIGGLIHEIKADGTIAVPKFCIMG